MPNDRPSMADALSAAGYRTHAIGKRHFTPDPHAPRGFQTLERQEEIVEDALQDEWQADQPFFLYSSIIHPHPPFSPPTPWHKLYRGPDMPLSKMAEDNESLYLYTNYRQNRYKGRDAGRDLRLHQLIKAYYWASISFIDFQVGRMLDTLEATGKLDNTLVIFASDHGEFLGDYNCFGKRSFLDSAARVPMLCRLPGTFVSTIQCFRSDASAVHAPPQ